MIWNTSLIDSFVRVPSPPLLSNCTQDSSASCSLIEGVVEVAGGTGVTVGNGMGVAGIIGVEAMVAIGVGGVVGADGGVVEGLGSCTSCSGVVDGSTSGFEVASEE